MCGGYAGYMHTIYTTSRMPTRPTRMRTLCAHYYAHPKIYIRCLLIYWPGGVARFRRTLCAPYAQTNKRPRVSTSPMRILCAHYALVMRATPVLYCIRYVGKTYTYSACQAHAIYATSVHFRPKATMVVHREHLMRTLCAPYAHTTHML